MHRFYGYGVLWSRVLVRTNSSVRKWLVLQNCTHVMGDTISTSWNEYEMISAFCFLCLSNLLSSRFFFSLSLPRRKCNLGSLRTVYCYIVAGHWDVGTCTMMLRTRASLLASALWMTFCDVYMDAREERLICMIYLFICR